ncbi:MAG: MOSC domain-containing protein, partial [Bacteroidetes bacterium]|nr:MOSC domain-containing protein [Bacteroidota bacterium]
GISIKQSKGKIIKIGDEIILEVMGETKPCYRMDEQVIGLTLALMKDWKGGVCCKVIQGGNLKVGDKIEID